MSLIIPSREIIRPATVSRRDFLRAAGITTTVVLMGSSLAIGETKEEECLDYVMILGDYYWFGNYGRYNVDIISRKDMKLPENQKRYRDTMKRSREQNERWQKEYLANSKNQWPTNMPFLR